MASGFAFAAAAAGTATLNPAAGAVAPFSFGGTPAASNTGTTGGLAFGAFGAAATPATTTAATGLGGGLFGAKPATGFTLGGANTATATTTSASTGFSIGFNKPAGSATPFSLPVTSTSSGGLSLASALTSTPATGPSPFTLNLGSTPATTTAASIGLSLGGTLTGLGGSLFQNINPSTGLGQITLGQSTLGQNTLGLGLNLGAVAPVSQAATHEGLGGLDFSNSSDKKSQKAGARPEDSKALKDENLPQLLCQDVENFQKFVKQQKQVQEEISRMSSKAMLKVQEDIKALKQLLSVASSGLQRNALAIDKLKIETAQELKNAEIALRTQKTPPGLQHENTAPAYYFHTLVQQFEVQLQQYRQQIEELENHLATQSNSLHLSPQDLSMAMQKLYQTFVALAAQLQAVNENFKMLKEQYLGYRKTFLGDSTDVFEARRVEAKKWQSAPRVTTGPTPFSNIPNAAAVAMAATLTQQQQPTTAGSLKMFAAFLARNVVRGLCLFPFFFSFSNHVICRSTSDSKQSFSVNTFQLSCYNLIDLLNFEQ
ncbi:nucleoporin 58kDa L homeolog isoform X2 [Xenopus laevis]|uniref:Nucleoporin 58kDa L homeolog isoform X2 n=1 Tax=Xenopus laevis TaxID=8355 RepID=A0A8J1M527_XENLA|nr:nucleoporin 58kDa L homeolog isoform X2 [Xenopus laevis]